MRGGQRKVDHTKVMLEALDLYVWGCSASTKNQTYSHGNQCLKMNTRLALSSSLSFFSFLLSWDVLLLFLVKGKKEALHL